MVLKKKGCDRLMERLRIVLKRHEGMPESLLKKLIRKFKLQKSYKSFLIPFVESILIPCSEGLRATGPALTEIKIDFICCWV
jgi:hypothetical protein